MKKSGLDGERGHEGRGERDRGDQEVVEDRI